MTKILEIEPLLKEIEHEEERTGRLNISGLEKSNRYAILYQTKGIIEKLGSDKPEPITGEWLKEIKLYHTDDQAKLINTHFLGKE